MCGIYGIFQRDGARADARLLTRMGDVIVHRGPDDSGSFVDRLLRDRHAAPVDHRSRGRASTDPQL